MRVALFTHSRVPADKYGGTERVVVWLARGLAELGHEVFLLAARGSRLPEARVIPLSSRETRRPDFDINRHLPPGIDILHDHGVLAVPAACPSVTTLHGNRKPGSVVSPTTICLSADHAARHGTAAFVYNGLDPADYRFAAVKDRYDLFLGRLHAAKGYQWAIAGARRAGRDLIVAGGWRPSFRPSLRFAGSVGGERKALLLAGARCLWMPALWNEPFGLTLIEALASGTPVLGTRRGALPEIITPAVGALGDTLDELVELRATVDRLDPETCRTLVEARFSHLVMAREYLRMYHAFLATGHLPPGRRYDKAVVPAGG
jgi:glycosyltransferase involved in cell wall biosynthesis